jgi:hypothetical protein
MSPQQSRLELAAVSDEAVAVALDMAGRVNGSPEVRRAALLDGIPEVIGFYADGAGVLATDFYDERREIAAVKSSFASEIIVTDRVVKIRRAVVWASEPLFRSLPVTLEQRLADVVQPEVSRVYRDTILDNQRRDPASAGWRRVTGVCCKFCRMLADKGAIYKRDTAQFAAHPHCDCGAEPVFRGESIGPEANNFQYLASKRRRSPAEKQALRDWLNAEYPD